MKLLTVRETAKLGLLSEHHLRMMIAQERVPGIRVGNRFLINIDAFMEQLQRESEDAVKKHLSDRNNPG